MLSPHDRANQVTITSSGGPAGRATLAIDGHELRCCTRAVLTLDAAEVPVLELSLVVLADMSTDLPAYVVLDGQARAALQSMGWTPPGSEKPA